MLHEKPESLSPAARHARKATIVRVATRLTATSEEGASARIAAFLLYPPYVSMSRCDCLCWRAA
jgi:hypothetical protein